LGLSTGYRRAKTCLPNGIDLIHDRCGICRDGRPKMAWKTPKIVEIALGAEINCYACAELTA
jgi:coenzyme PQQ precursor peptide PqqA